MSGSYFKISIADNSGYHSFDDLVQQILTDPMFSKKFPMITHGILHGELDRFIEGPPSKTKGVGIDNGEIFKRENGRQVAGSHRYIGVLEVDGIFNLYKKFKGGEKDGEIWCIPRIHDETHRVAEFIFKFNKNQGRMPLIRETEDHFREQKIIVSRDRIQIVLRAAYDAIDIVKKKTSTDYDVTLISSTSSSIQNVNLSAGIATNSSSCVGNETSSQSRKRKVSSSSTSHSRSISSDLQQAVLTTQPSSSASNTNQQKKQKVQALSSTGISSSIDSSPSQQTKIVTAAALVSNTRATPVHDRLRSRKRPGTTSKLPAVSPPASKTTNKSKSRSGTKNKHNLDEKQ